MFADKLTVAGVDVTDAIAVVATLDGLTATAAELNKLDGATVTVNEINILDGVTATAAEINSLDGGVQGATITVGADAGTTVTNHIQFEDGNGADLAQRCAVMAFLSDDANGDSIAATAPDGGVAAGSDGFMTAIVADKQFWLFSEADGDMDIVVTESATDTWYLVVVMPNSTYVVSDPIAFTA